MEKTSFDQLLLGLENYSKFKNLSKKDLAQKLNIPYSTLRKWFSKSRTKRFPSPDYMEKINHFLESEKKEDRYWGNIWMKILSWWQSQHRFSSIKKLAEEIGWEPQNLFLHFQNKQMPPKIVVGKIAGIAGLEISALDSIHNEARKRTEKIKMLLLLLEDELKWLRDNSPASREIFRQELDLSDVGYISSLLTMLGDEEKFKRWITLTTNRFDYFRKKGRKK
jgi:transcriptional regulator with XRE-family HTH domain